MNVLAISLFLATTGVGYWVLTLADREGNPRTKLGKVLGWGIILFSILALLTQLLPMGWRVGGPGRGHSLFGHPGNGRGHGHWGGKEDEGDD